jgi:hypothetical protein
MQLLPVDNEKLQDKSLSIGSDRIIYFYLHPCTFPPLSSNSLVELNTSTHIVATSDGNTAKIFINGKLDSSANVSTSCDVGDRPETSYFIGYGVSDGIPSRTRSFQGAIDELRIYNRALSEAEVTSLYNMGQQLSGTVNGVQKYSAVCKNTKTSVTKKIAVTDGAKEWNCKTAGLQTKKGDIVTVTITGVSQ